MVKYELQRGNIEVKYRDRKKIKQGIVLTSVHQEPELIKDFDNKEEALEELQKYKSSIREHTYNRIFYIVEEYYVEKNIYDDEDETEWLEGGDVWGISKMEIKLIEKPSYNTLAVFDNMADAEKAESDYAGVREVFLSF